MATTQYIGARYVPLFADPAEWDSGRQYEPLTIVIHEGNSYTSRQYVPAGIEITNEKFWALTGNYNAQVDQYRQDVKSFDGRITANASSISTEVNDRKTAISAEASDRKTAISAEASDRKTADTEISTNLSTEINDRKTADTEITQNLSTEINDRKSADSILQTDVKSESNRAKAAEQSLSNRIAANVSALDTKVDKNGNEQVTWNNLSQDVKNRLVSGDPTGIIAADSVNTSNIVDNAVTLTKLNSVLQNNYYVKLERTFTAYSGSGYYIGEIGAAPTKVENDAFNYVQSTLASSNFTQQTIFALNEIILDEHFSNANQLIWLDSNGKIISKISNAQNSGKSLILLNPPVGATSYILNISKNEPQSCLMYLTEANMQADNVRATLTQLSKPIAPSKTLIDTIFSTIFLNGSSYHGYNTYIYKVTPGEKVKLKGTMPDSAQFSAGVWIASFVNGNLDISSMAGILGEASEHYTDGSSGTYDIDTIVPSGAQWYVVCNANNLQTIQRYELPINNDNSYNANLSVTINGTEISVNANNNNGVTFDRYGGNNLYMPHIFKTAGYSRTLFTDTFPAPYIVYAVNNATGDNKDGHFTGGNHGYNIDGSGTHTAELQSYHAYIDGKEISDNGTYSGSTFELVCVNRVQAANTILVNGNGRFVLQEENRFRFDGNRLYVSNVITPLEEINIVRYYGIQLTGWLQEDYHVITHYGYGKQSQNEAVAPYGWYAKDDNGSIFMHMNPVGLGSYYLTSPENLWTASNGKAYYFPIDGSKSQNITTDNILYESGYYELGKVSTF